MKKAIVVLSSLILFGLINIAYGEDSEEVNVVVIDFSNKESIWDAMGGAPYYRNIKGFVAIAPSRGSYTREEKRCKSWSQRRGGDINVSGVAVEYVINYAMSVIPICYGDMEIYPEEAKGACNVVLKREFISVDRYIVRCGPLFHQSIAGN